MPSCSYAALFTSELFIWQAHYDSYTSTTLDSDYRYINFITHNCGRNIKYDTIAVMRVNWLKTVKLHVHIGSGNITVGYIGRLTQIKQSIKVRKQKPWNAQHKHIRWSGKESVTVCSLHGCAIAVEQRRRARAGADRQLWQSKSFFSWSHSVQCLSFPHH